MSRPASKSTRNQPAAGNPTADESTSNAPGWFQRKRARQQSEASRPPQTPRTKSQQRAGVAVNAGAEQGGEQTAGQWSVKDDFLAFGVSLFLHLLLLVLMSIAVVRSVSQGEGDGLFAKMVGENETVVDDQLDTRLEPLDSEPVESELPQLKAVDTQSPQPQPLELPSGMLADIGATAANGDASQPKSRGGLPFRMPGGGKAVTKGSFTVWTIPEDPEPFQDYMIVIQIKLPRKMRHYPRNDLSGLVVGTDQYRQELPGFGLPMAAHLPIEDMTTQLAVPVPGAEGLVKDTIKVKSDLLDEEQTIEIEF